MNTTVACESYRLHLQRARERIRTREMRRARQDAVLARQASEDAQAIIDMIVQTFSPSRIYQWGSLLRPDGFKSYSDIDIALEGIVDAERFFALLGQAQSLTAFPVDIVQLEKIAPEYADDIRHYGRLVYEDS